MFSCFCRFNDFLCLEIFFFRFWVFANHPTVHNGEIRGWGSVAVGVSDRWQVTRDTRHATHNMWHMTNDMWHLTCNTWHMTFNFFFPLFLIFLSVLCIGFTIRTCQEIQCLPYVGFLLWPSPIRQSHGLGATWVTNSFISKGASPKKNAA